MFSVRVWLWCEGNGEIELQDYGDVDADGEGLSPGSRAGLGIGGC